MKNVIMTNKKFWLGMLVMALVFGMTVVGCKDGDQPGTSASNPINRISRENLGTMTSPVSGWRDLLNSINRTGKYINLDLSACNMTGTSFNPDPSVETGKKYIVSIILPAVATSIQRGTHPEPAFKSFTNLKSISGANIITIDDNIFRSSYDDTYLRKLRSVDFPKAATIAPDAFRGTYLESMNFPLVTTIGDNAFSGCSNLTNAAFPLAQSIGEGAFAFCLNLKSISFPASAELGLSSGNYSNPFASCGKLTFTLSGEGSLSVTEHGKALVRNGTILLAYPSASGDITMNNITALDGKAFQDCYRLKSVSFPQVISIGSETFASCSNIQDVSFSQVTSIGSSAFFNCGKLQEVSFPSVTTIGSSAFSSCPFLTIVEIPEVADIGQEAFSSTDTEGTDLFITMGGATAPTLGNSIFMSVNSVKKVTVEVPAGATGYSPFTGTTVTVSDTDAAVNWANGFRGGGWDGSSFVQGFLPNHEITVIIQQQ